MDTKMDTKTDTKWIQKWIQKQIQKMDTKTDTKIPGCRGCESLSLIPDIRVFYLLHPSYLKCNTFIYSIPGFYCVLKLEYPSTFKLKSLRSSEKFGL